MRRYVSVSECNRARRTRLWIREAELTYFFMVLGESALPTAVLAPAPILCKVVDLYQTGGSKQRSHRRCVSAAGSPTVVVLLVHLVAPTKIGILLGCIYN